ncbi:hypothetical protein L3X38_015544 [Prunus dulcis]|uniref:Uncharacterized protein n=1 Tax=Prunus dulcis TaxID=3755 RepID=A0AAD4Z7C3_PRUDU|nr:hypothetical protein L3X38_015544 [Prunus dulcis]
MDNQEQALNEKKKKLLVSTTILCSSVPQVQLLSIFLGGVLWSGDAFKVQYALTAWIMGELLARVACSPHSQFKALVHLVTGYSSLVVMVPPHSQFKALVHLVTSYSSLVVMVDMRWCIASACYGYEDTGFLIEAASKEIWDNRAACGHLFEFRIPGIGG